MGFNQRLIFRVGKAVADMVDNPDPDDTPAVYGIAAIRSLRRDGLNRTKKNLKNTFGGRANELSDWELKVIIDCFTGWSDV